MTTHIQEQAGRAIRLLVCDAQALFVTGIRTLLAGSADVRLIGEAKDASQVVALAKARRPDVVMLGLPLVEGELLPTVAQLQGPGEPFTPAILVMATSSDEDELLEAVRAGVRGVVSRTCSGADLVRDVRAVASGRAVLAPSMAARLVELAAGPGPAAERPVNQAALTPREAEVLTLVAQGLSDTAIAKVLWVSKVTVRSHIHRTIAKLGMTTRAQAVAYYYQNGLFRNELTAGRKVSRV
ncbi:LuxR C-terminal-related transcriptional regulator [Micromonospora echinospora]|uniref:LuxR C-terminal-related transcriptional regulator n=1 Tax=Micromonospora echinospora TaxID=1877 RepID=UPI00367333A5